MRERELRERVEREGERERVSRDIVERVGSELRERIDGERELD